MGVKTKAPLYQIQTKTTNMKRKEGGGGGKGECGYFLGQHKYWDAIYLLQKLLKQKKD